MAERPDRAWVPAAGNRQALLVHDAELPAQLDEVEDRAEVDVGRVEPLRRQRMGDRHAPCTSRCQRTRQWPKLGNETMARRPMRTSCFSTWCGLRVACNVWLSTT